jgi:predicted esterase
VADPTPLVRTIPARTLGRYLIDNAESRAPLPLLVGFHGYRENAEKHLEDLRRIPGAEATRRVAVQGLHRFMNLKTNEIVASWMTRQDREQAIADNVDYVASVLDAVDREHPGDGRRVFVGFSQGTSMAYRAAAKAGHPGHGLIVLGGDMPPELADDPSPLPPVLIGRGARDSWYTEERMANDLERLRRRGVLVETLVFDGGHEWTDEFRSAAGRFLGRVLAGG